MRTESTGCTGYRLSRRTFVGAAAGTFLGMNVRTLVARAGEDRKATAEHVILFWNGGGMSHIDTFDPKVGESKGPKKAIATKAGFQVTECLPKIAAISDKICVIRSMTAKIGVHEAAKYFMRTGFEKRGTIQHPTLGAWAQHYLGNSSTTLPASVCVNRNSDHGNGFFPATFSPLPILDPDAGLQHATSPAGNEAVEKRLALVNQLDQGFRQRFDDENVSAYNDFYDNTIRLMKSNDIKAFDLGAESSHLRDGYGRNKFGQGCLLARRLIENGIRSIEVVSGGWDMHNNLEESLTTRGGEFDQAFSALISDLDARGLLKSTLVAVTTEFGRKPDFQGTGRGHYPKVFTTVLAGAGIKRGYVHGSSDALGAEVASNGVTVGQLHASIGWAAGLPLAQPTLSPSGRPFTVGNKAQPVAELFA
jgi:hypothetical protein